MRGQMLRGYKVELSWEASVTLIVLTSISLTIAFASAFVILIDEIRHPQKIAVMNVVWPIFALYLSLFAVSLLLGRPQK